jgi:hypothetical protein
MHRHSSKVVIVCGATPLTNFLVYYNSVALCSKANTQALGCVEIKGKLYFGAIIGLGTK